MKSPKGLTLIEMVVVMGIISILAITTIIYGRGWLYQQRFSNMSNTLQSAVKHARMFAVSVGSDTYLVFTDAYVDPITKTMHVATKFSGDAQTVGPVTVGSRRYMYFLYNYQIYTATPVTTTFMFNARGLPVDYQERSVTITSAKAKRTYILKVSPAGRLE